MNTVASNLLPLEPQILSFGRDVFAEIGRTQPSAFNKNYWSGRMMEWAMKLPDFKINMFRLVDVLPSLKTSAAIARHVQEYLAAPAHQIHPFLGWAMAVSPGTFRGAVAALAVKTGVQQTASQFIVGSDPKNALRALKKLRKRRLSFTVDLLGEFSVSEKEALIYVDRYLEALKVFGEEIPQWPESMPLMAGHPGEQNPVCVSVKLSALYSQCTPLNFDRSVSILSERLSTIVSAAKKIGALVYVDAEDSANNPIIYAVFERVFGSSEFKDFPYPGIVLQAYTIESEKTCRALLDFAKRRGAPIAVRLVKGAYWDHETISSQMNGWPSPLFSKKESSDAQFEHLSRILLDNREHCLPAFGSHNVRSLAHACTYAQHVGAAPTEFELQMLFGMADPIADAFSKRGYLVRMYAPLGEMLPGMGYLVRRLLENTSNESFLRHTFFDQKSIESLLTAPRSGE